MLLSFSLRTLECKLVFPADTICFPYKQGLKAFGLKKTVIDGIIAKATATKLLNVFNKVENDKSASFFIQDTLRKGTD